MPEIPAHSRKKSEADKSRGSASKHKSGSPKHRALNGMEEGGLSVQKNQEEPSNQRPYCQHLEKANGSVALIPLLRRFD